MRAKQTAKNAQTLAGQAVSRAVVKGLKVELNFQQLHPFIYLHFFDQAGFSEVHILLRVKISQRIHQYLNINVVIIVKMTKPSERKIKTFSPRESVFMIKNFLQEVCEREGAPVGKLSQHNVDNVNSNILISFLSGVGHYDDNKEVNSKPAEGKAHLFHFIRAPCESAPCCNKFLSHQFPTPHYF